MRIDNHEQRKNFVLYSTLAVGFLSFAFLKKGYVRHSVRNTSLYFVGSSYVVCPENFNPF